MIAARADRSEVTLFRHFTGKLELFKAVLEEYSTLRLFTEEFAETLSRDLRTDLERMARRFCEMLDHSTEAMLVSISEAIRIPEVRSLVAESPRKGRPEVGTDLLFQREATEWETLPRTLLILPSVVFQASHSTIR